MKVTTNDNEVAPPRPIIDDNSVAMLSNYSSEEVNSKAIVSNFNQGEIESMSSDRNNGLIETLIADVMSLSTSTVIGNNNCILSNKQMNTVSSKRPARICSAVGNRDLWYTAIGDQESRNEFDSTKSADDCIYNTRNNILNEKKQSLPASWQKTTRGNLGAREETREYERIVKKCSLPSGVLLERPTQDDICPTLRCHLNNMNANNKEKIKVSDPTQKEGEPLCLLGVPTEFQVDKKESVLFQEESERNASPLMEPFNERESQANENTTIIKEAEENSESLPSYLHTIFVEGSRVCGDTYVPFSKPDWLDMEKFKRGQRFANNHLFGVLFAQLLSLMVLFTFPDGLEHLIYTGKSDTPFKAFKRYLSTVSRVKSWYEGDIWDTDSEAHKNLKAVRRIHDGVRKSMEAVPPQEISKRLTLENKEDTHPMWTDLHEEVRDDLLSSCPFSRSRNPNEVYISQYGMATTQFGFIGLVMVFPKMFGIHYASDEDFEGFAHFWRTIGYVLGTGDRFNLCNGDLKTVRQRCVDFIEHMVKPQLRDVSRDWIHMSRCVFKGISFYVPNVRFEVMLMYLCKMLDIKAVRLAASLTFWQYLIYHQVVFLFWFTFRLPGMWRLHNWIINLAVKQALQMSPERLTKLEHRVYPYETSSGTTSTRR